jgi:hypothetical protein
MTPDEAFIPGRTDTASAARHLALPGAPNLISIKDLRLTADTVRTYLPVIARGVSKG